MLSSDTFLRTLESDLEGLWLPEDPLVECLEAHRYPLAAGGKRVRPLLVLLTAAAIGGESGAARARPTACAIELVHTYSLVHDDLPCMDDDALRRGLPTAHVIYGEAKALLAGDGLLTHALFLVASRGRAAPWLETLSTREEACDVVEALTLAAGPYGMVGGQWLDLTLTPPRNEREEPALKETQQPARTFETVLRIHRLKTGRLLGAALECGLIHGLHAAGVTGGSEAESLREDARDAGEDVGIAFQIIDDILDVTGASEALGKSAGKDEREGKLTSVSTLGLSGAREKAAFHTSRAREALNRLLVKTGAGTRGDVSRAACDLLESTLESLLTRSR